MILVDALYINEGGGEILLEYLIKELEKLNSTIFYLLDSRLSEQDYSIKNSNKVVFLQASISNRKKFYKENNELFNSVFCFANIPPPIKLKCSTYTYFHQKLILEIPENYSLKSKILFFLKRQFIKSLKKNTDFWFLQTNLIGEQLIKVFREDSSKICVLPFYVSLPKFEKEKEKYTYLYVSTGYPHKNHARLIESFCRFYDELKIGKLILTVDPLHSEVYKLIECKINEGYPIENHGFVSSDKLALIYAKSEYLIFPSLQESFGLGLIEAVDFNCKILASDLPYVYEVCEPSLVFNPLSVESIYKTFVTSYSNKFVVNSRILVNNSIDLIIEKINNEN